VERRTWLLTVSTPGLCLAPCARWPVPCALLPCALCAALQATREKLEDAIEGHVLDEAELVATYTKEKLTSGIEQGVRNHAIKEGSLWKGGQ